MRSLSTTQNNVVLGTSFLTGALTAAAFVALLIMFPPAAVATLGVVALYGVAIAVTTGLSVLLIHFAIGKLYNPEARSTFYGSGSPSDMRRSFASSMAGQMRAAKEKGIAQDVTAYFSAFIIGGVLFWAAIAAPFAITVIVATVITGLTVGAALGSIAASIAYCAFACRKEKSSPTVNSSKKPSTTTQTNQSLNIDEATLKANLNSPTPSQSFPQHPDETLSVSSEVKTPLHALAQKSLR